ncbi:uncharacterized protein UTRI_06062_B [Ustilago trichophora]|uniref:Uncharacterized protein n=1 Tax=Ustilago trichophora TaxID=86804 RepID=A0A5C3EHN1_9BASI|nr:uncharacterized protein UTRI_06062_B [Ustilago trichophora]
MCNAIRAQSASTLFPFLLLFDIVVTLLVCDNHHYHHLNSVPIGNQHFTMTTPFAAASSTTTNSAFHHHTLPPQLHPSLRPQPSRMLFIRDCLRLSSSVLPRILPSVLCLTLYATFIALADLVWEAKWTTSYSVTSSLSVVVGLLLVFRNGTSYDRWYEGRKLWADASATVENLARLIWVNVDTQKDAERGKREWRLERKKRGLRLLYGYLIAVKHELRGEKGMGWQDFERVLPEEWLKAGMAIQHDDTIGLKAKVKSDLEQGGSAGSRSTLGIISETSPLLCSPTHPHMESSSLCLSLPHLILTELHIYLSSVRRAGLLDDLGPAGFSLVNTQLLTLSTLFSSMIRISSTPTPLIYAIHLKQSCFIYLVTLPLALVGELGWKIIPFVTVFSVMLIGLEGISSEIEDPFGVDKSDHDLDRYCFQVKYHIETLMLEILPGVRDE